MALPSGTIIRACKGDGAKDLRTEQSARAHIANGIILTVKSFLFWVRIVSDKFWLVLFKNLDRDWLI